MITNQSTTGSWCGQNVCAYTCYCVHECVHAYALVQGSEFQRHVVRALACPLCEGQFVPWSQNASACQGRNVSFCPRGSSQVRACGFVV